MSDVTEASRRGKAARNRGYETERMVAKYLRANGYPDAATTRQVMGRSGNRTPGDISFHPLVILEVKARKQSRWPEWCRQAAAEAGEGQVPVVVRRTPGVADPGAWECRVQWKGWRSATDGCSLIAMLDIKPGDEPVHRFVTLNETPWLATTLAEFVALLHRFDTVDGA